MLCWEAHRTLQVTERLVLSVRALHRQTPDKISWSAVQEGFMGEVGFFYQRGIQG